MLRITGLRLALDEDLEKLPRLIARRLGIAESDILDWKVFKESIDARQKRQLSFVYTVDVRVKEPEALLGRLKDSQVSFAPEYKYEFVPSGTVKLQDPPVIVGSGPAGLFAGLLLARLGYRPLLLERGFDVDTRTAHVQQFWETGQLNPQSNVQFGEGGAGTFSDGKLTTLIKDPRCRKVLEELVEAGGPAEILYSYRPHIGTDILKEVVKRIRQQIQELGGQIRFGACVTGLETDSSGLRAVLINGQERLPCQALVLAIGHSARDTLEVLHHQGLVMAAKPFSVGVRIEHLQEWINKAQYKEMAGHPRLGAADYKLAYHSPRGRSAYTFCMCPGGMVVAAASEEGRLVTNGMSYHARDGQNANSALLVGVSPADYPNEHPLAGIDFQRQWEERAFAVGDGGYQAPAQLVGDFLAGKGSTGFGQVQPTYKPGVVPADLKDCLPAYVVETLQEAIISFGRKLQGFDHQEAVLTGVETRSSSPVRILRDADYQASIPGLYPAGEGAGYAGGIISAAVDGLRCAEAIARKYKPLNKKEIG